MATVSQVLALAEELKLLSARERELTGIIASTTSKGDRLTGDLNSIRGQITAKKNQLKAAAAAME